MRVYSHIQVWMWGKKIISHHSGAQPNAPSNTRKYETEEDEEEKKKKEEEEEVKNEKEEEAANK